MTIDLAAIRKRAEDATDGPWKVTNENEGTEYLPFWVIGGDDAEEGEWFAELHVGNKADATFIANARQDVPALIAEVERLRTQQARLIAELEKADKFSDALRAELFRQQLPGIRKIVEDCVQQRKEDD